MRQPGIVAPLVGATKPYHIDDACAALELKLDAEEMKSLADAKPYEVQEAIALRPMPPQIGTVNFDNDFLFSIRARFTGEIGLE